MTYNRTFNFGDIAFSAALSDPNVTVTKATPAAAPNSAFGHQPKRSSASLFWGQGAWDAGVAVNYQARYFINGLTAASFPSHIEWNPQASYNFARDSRFSAGAPEWWARTLSGSKLSVTIINLFNRDPERGEAASGRIVMDPRLRRYIVSFSKKF